MSALRVGWAAVLLVVLVFVLVAGRLAWLVFVGAVVEGWSAVGGVLVADAEGLPRAWDAGVAG